MKISPWFAVAALLLIAAAALPDDQPGSPTGNVRGTITDSTGDNPAFREASCDMNGNAFGVKPDTASAIDAAQAWCDRADASFDQMTWPAHVTPVPLDDALTP
jgi:hypothetical protein